MTFGWTLIEHEAVVLLGAQADLWLPVFISSFEVFWLLFDLLNYLDAT